MYVTAVFEVSSSILEFLYDQQVLLSELGCFLQIIYVFTKKYNENILSVTLAIIINTSSA